MVILKDRELATVLVALRNWQVGFAALGVSRVAQLWPQFEGVAPLSLTEIDELCERLNVRDAAEDEVPSHLQPGTECRAYSTREVFDRLQIGQRMELYWDGDQIVRIAKAHGSVDDPADWLLADSAVMRDDGLAFSDEAGRVFVAADALPTTEEPRRGWYRFTRTS